MRTNRARQLNTVMGSIMTVDVEQTGRTMLDVLRDYIDYVPTRSAMSKLIKTHINNLLGSHPEYSYVIYSLLTYSTHSWASEMRQEIGLEQDSYMELYEKTDNVLRQEEHIFRCSGIKPMLRSNDRYELLTCSDELLSVVNTAVEDLKVFPGSGQKMYEVIYAAHYAPIGMKTHLDVSRKLLDKYYDLAVEIIYRKYGDAIRVMFSNLISMSFLNRSTSRELYSNAYHNTKLLLRIYKALVQLYSRTDIEIASNSKLQNVSDGLYLIKITRESISAIREYPIEGEQMYKLLNLLIQGKDSKEIAKQIGCSEAAYARKKIRAINLLSFVLWGYSTPQIVNNLIIKPENLSKKQKEYSVEKEQKSHVKDINKNVLKLFKEDKSYTDDPRRINPKVYEIFYNE